MTDATTGANKAKTAKHSASPFGMPNYEMPKFDLPKMEMPEAFREMAEKGVAQAKDSYEKIQAAVSARPAPAPPPRPRQRPPRTGILKKNSATSASSRSAAQAARACTAAHRGRSRRSYRSGQGDGERPFGSADPHVWWR